MYYLVSMNGVRPSWTSFSVFRIFRRPIRNLKPAVIRARPLSWDIPQLIFERPERLLPRPERLFEGTTFKDFILSQEEAVRNFPWDYVIFLFIAIFFIVEFVIKPFDETSSDEAEEAEEGRQISTVDREQWKKKEMTREQEAIYAMQKAEFQADQNRNLLILGSFTALALWLAGFVNTRHPFEP